MEEFYLIKKPIESFSGYGDGSLTEISNKLNEISNKIDYTNKITLSKNDKPMK